MKNEIENLLTAAEKREVAKSINRYVIREIEDLASRQAQEVAQKWVKANAEWIAEETRKQCEKETKKFIKNLCLDVTGY